MNYHKNFIYLNKYLQISWSDDNSKRHFYSWLISYADQINTRKRTCIYLAINSLVYCSMYIPLSDETAQKSALEIQDKFSLRQNAVQDKIQF